MLDDSAGGGGTNGSGASVHDHLAAAAAEVVAQLRVDGSHTRREVLVSAGLAVAKAGKMEGLIDTEVCACVCVDVCLCVRSAVCGRGECCYAGLIVL